MVVTSWSAVRSHYRLGSINLGLVKRTTLGILVGVALGYPDDSIFPSVALRLMRDVFLILLTAQMAFSPQPPPGWELPAPSDLATLSADSNGTAPVRH